MENHDTLKFNKHDSADASAIFSVNWASRNSVVEPFRLSKACLNTASSSSRTDLIWLIHRITNWRVMKPSVTRNMIHTQNGSQLTLWNPINRIYIYVIDKK